MTSHNGAMAREVEKAVCYVLHNNHLLVFTHNNVPLTVTGVQVPAGSIKPGESPERAAVRELHEETDRPGQILSSVGVQRYDLRPTRNEIAVRHYFEMRMTDADESERWVAGESDPSTGRETSLGLAGGSRCAMRTFLQRDSVNVLVQ
ncbi:hypothetical protein GCM10027404_32750 [Arthrobacter tumbae]|uniref:NUDIX domain-containing protein n=1 Tax=Arthrobacter tumbae TaxID=163874 RepID=UPI00195E5169|nr:NUDIX domain-containing protein [Arthrobacter tumbae]MBM7781235.1 8-oxo-dGTP pyrophosphatase MutT (NUDIX family) [Arthrobacter tumbae]